MTTVEQATQIIQSNLLNFGTEKVPLARAVGRILAENLTADRAFPPFDRVSMDGIALRADDFFSGKKTFKIAGFRAAGSNADLRVGEVKNAPTRRSVLPDCIEIMTGAVLPAGADAVVRYEDLQIENGQATLNLEKLERWQNVHREGIDRKKGDLLVPAATRISPAEIATAATVGKSKIEVARLPRVAVISTGNELVAVSKTPAAHQIRMSNAHAIAAALRQNFGIEAKIFHLRDDEKKMRLRLAEVLEKFSVLILSGAVSKGKLDFLPKILPELGVEMLFHRVAQRPGNPFWFGKRGEKNVVFAPPGNPVSTFMVCHRYILPWLAACFGQKVVSQELAVLSEQVVFKPDLTYFLQVKLASSPTDGRLVAHPLHGHGSGDLANLNDADAFLELPRGREVFSAGEVFPIFRFR